MIHSLLLKLTSSILWVYENFQTLRRIIITTSSFLQLMQSRLCFKRSSEDASNRIVIIVYSKCLFLICPTPSGALMMILWCFTIVFDIFPVNISTFKYQSLNHLHIDTYYYVIFVRHLKNVDQQCIDSPCEIWFYPVCLYHVLLGAIF